MTAYRPEPGIPGEPPDDPYGEDHVPRRKGVHLPGLMEAAMNAVPAKPPWGDYTIQRAPDHRCCKTKGCPPLAELSSPSGDYTLETFAIRVSRALELNGPVDPYKLLMYNGFVTRVMNLPNQTLRALSGLGHQPSDIEARAIIPWPLPEGSWLWKPWDCRVADGHRGVWVDEEHLACPGCGMDFT